MPTSKNLKRIAYTPSGRYRTQRTTSTYRPRQRRRRGSPEQRERVWRWVGRLVGLGFLLGSIGLLVGIGLFVWYSRGLPDPDNLTRRTAAQSTKIYDRTGETLLFEIKGETQRDPVALTDLPPHLINATLVAEDRNFYTHRGFDLRGIARAIIVNIFSNQLQGGSTITQQLVKNAIVGADRTFERKIKELILAYRIEQRFTKDEVLAMYLNTIPYGGSSYGIEAAAQRFFGKSARDLTPAESSVLAALPKAPSTLSPYGGNQDRLTARQHYILDQMHRLGFSDAQTTQEAKATELVFKPLGDNIIAPHFVFYVRELLADRYGEQFVETGGLKVITSLDLHHQEIAEEVVTEGAERNEEEFGGKNAALVAIDPKTGHVLAMVGSRDYFDDDIDGQVNVALRPRQPGSSFKPLVYAAAFDRGFTPDTVLYDVNTTFKTDPEDYAPVNYDEAQHGPVSIRQALAGSLNIPAVKAIYLAGIDNVLNLADRLGYTTLKDRSRFGLSLVLGGGEVKLLEHVAAYQALARDGIYREPTPILRVENGQGELIDEFEARGRNVLPTQVARQVTNVLSDNNARAYVFGLSSPLQLGDRPVAAKTGTTNDFRDGWTIGYTPSLVAGVWAGNNDNTAMTRGTGGSVAAPIWNSFMSRVLGDTPREAFKAPRPLTGVGNPALFGPVPSEVTVVIDRASGKRATDRTPEAYREERTFTAMHSILHYIDRQNPTGPPPTDPASDPNYENWETAVVEWAEANGQELGVIPPREYDDVHIPENEPQLLVTSPAPGQTVRGTELEITAVATATRGVARIVYKLNGVPLGERDSSGTFRASFPAEISAGFHELTIEAFDDVGNQRTVRRTFNYIP